MYARQDPLTRSVWWAQEKARRRPRPSLPGRAKGEGVAAKQKWEKIEGHSSSCRVKIPKIADVGLPERRDGSAGVGEKGKWRPLRLAFV